MNDKMILVEQMQMLVDLYAVQTNEKHKDLAVLIIAQVLAHHQQDGLED
ncbi:hypothetical protein [Shewanella xiamenensis]